MNNTQMGSLTVLIIIVTACLLSGAFSGTENKYFYWTGHEHWIISDTNVVVHDMAEGKRIPQGFSLASVIRTIKQDGKIKYVLCRPDHFEKKSKRFLWRIQIMYKNSRKSPSLRPGDIVQFLTILREDLEYEEHIIRKIGTLRLPKDTRIVPTPLLQTKSQ